MTSTQLTRWVLSTGLRAHSCVLEYYNRILLFSRRTTLLVVSTGLRAHSCVLEYYNQILLFSRRTLVRDDDTANTHLFRWNRFWWHRLVGRGSLRPFTVAALLLSPSGKEAALDVPRLTVCWSNLGRLVFARRVEWWGCCVAVRKNKINKSDRMTKK